MKSVKQKQYEEILDKIQTAEDKLVRLRIKLKAFWEENQDTDTQRLVIKYSDPP